MTKLAAVHSPTADNSGSPPARRAWRPHVLIAASLAAAIIAVYWPVRSFDFVDLDDGQYVTENAIVQEGLTWHSMSWAFRSGATGNWLPLTWLSHMLDCQLFGLSAPWHHETSVLLHIANSILVYVLFWRMTAARWRSAFVAGLFALHPLHVESVAWISERKDVLSTLFGLLALLAYVRYCRQPRFHRMLVVLLLLCLSLMSKAMLVTLPVLMLLLDYWPLGRLGTVPIFAPAKMGLSPSAPALRPLSGHRPEVGRERVRVRAFSLAGGDALTPYPSRAPTGTARSVVDWSGRGDYQCIRQLQSVGSLMQEKAILLVPALAVCAIALHTQAQAGALSSLGSFPLVARLSNVLTGYVGYLVKTFWPSGLCVYYPALFSMPWGEALAKAALLVLATITVVVSGRRLPYLPVGWFWYLISLLPVIGLVQIGGQSMADRYTYLPLVGIFVIVTWGASDLVGRWRLVVRQVEHDGLGATGCLSASAADPGRQAARGTGQLEVGRPRGRWALGLAAIGALVACGVLSHVQLSYWSDSEPLFRRMLEITPQSARAHAYLAGALARDGDMDEAEKYAREALHLQSSNRDARMTLAAALKSKGQFGEAIEHYRAVLHREPDDLKAQVDLARLLATCRDPTYRDGPEAVRLAERARDLTEGEDLKTLRTLAAAYAEACRFSDAMASIDQALALAKQERQAAQIADLQADRRLFESGRARHEGEKRE